MDGPGLGPDSRIKSDRVPVTCMIINYNSELGPLRGLFRAARILQGPHRFQARRLAIRETPFITCALLGFAKPSVRKQTNKQETLKWW